MSTKLRDTESICPKCHKIVRAQIVEIDGIVKMVKNCPQHGDFQDIYWGNAEHYSWIMQYQTAPLKLDDTSATQAKDCAQSCGLCAEQNVKTVIAIIDVTNRCDLRCPICFTSSGDPEYLYEPSVEQIRGMLQNLRNRNKSPIGPTVAFSGGEPTLRDDIPELVKMAQEEGFPRTEVITDGIRIAEEPDYAMALSEAGLSQLGLQFDGLDDEIYLKLRGKPLLQTKLRAIENLRTANQPVILAMCLVKGINEHQIGDILRFAAQHKDIVEHVNVQTIAYAGRGAQFNPLEGRITPTEFIKLVEEQTGGDIKQTDFYPPAFAAPVPEFIEAYTEKPQIKFSVHPCCDMATYVLVNKDGSFTPINKLFNITKLLDVLKGSTQKLLRKKGLSKKLYRLIAPFTVLKVIAGQIKSPIFKDLFFSALKNKGYDPLAGLKDVLMITCANYMDAWNFDLDKAHGCSMHYLLPDGSAIPFCCYNLLHRTRMESIFGTLVQGD